MKPHILTLQSLMDTYGVSLADRGAVAYTAAAQAIAYHLAMPAAPVSNPYGYFLEKFREEVDGYLDDLNEAFVIRMAEARELIKHLWVFRYRLVYDVTNPSVRNALDAIIAGGDRHLSPVYVELTTKYRDVLNVASVQLTSVIAPPDATGA